MTTITKRAERISAITTIAIAGGFIATIGSAIAATQNGATQSSIPSDGGAVKSGDVILWKVNKAITLQPDPTTPAAAAGSPTAVCFPYDSRFNVTSVVAATTPAPADANKGAATSNTQIVSGHFSSDIGYALVHPLHITALPQPQKAAPTPAASSPCGAIPMAVYDKTYYFTADALADNDFYRQGLTWGGLVIPYKYYFTDHSMKSNSSVVAYLGYEGWFPGMTLAAVVALGPGTAPTPSTTSQGAGGSSTNSTAASVTAVTYTAAVGLVASFGDSQTFKAGVMFGRDYQGNAAAFPYENKTWMALSIGAGF